MTIYWGFNTEKLKSDGYTRSFNLELDIETSKFSYGRTWVVYTKWVNEEGLQLLAFPVSTTPCEVWVNEKALFEAFIDKKLNLTVIRDEIHEKDEDVLIRDNFHKELNNLLESTRKDQVGPFYWLYTWEID